MLAWPGYRPALVRLARDPLLGGVSLASAEMSCEPVDTNGLIRHGLLFVLQEAWLRRLGWVLGSKGQKGRSSGIAMYCVVAGEAADFRVVEGFLASGRIEVMPVQVEEIFVQ